MLKIPDSPSNDAVRARDPCHLARGSLRLIKILQVEQGEGRIEHAIRERKRFGAAYLKS